MIGTVTGMTVNDGLTVETVLDPAAQPFLDDHRIDGTPVLPGVMGVESFAEAAGLLFPDMRVAAVEDVEFLAPFKFYRDEPRTVTVRARFRSEGQDVLADCRLEGTRTLPNQPEPQVTTHFTGTVRLVAGGPDEATAEVPANGDEVVGAEPVYRVYFHGPAFQVLETAWRDGDTTVGLYSHDLPSGHEPSKQPLTMAPRLVELCFQTAGVWEIGTTGRMALPTHVDRVRRYSDPPSANGRLLAVVTPRPDDQSFDASIVDENGRPYIALEGYRTVQLPGGVETDKLAPLQKAMR